MSRLDRCRGTTATGACQHTARYLVAIKDARWGFPACGVHMAQLVRATVDAGFAAEVTRYDESRVFSASRGVTA